MSSLTDCKLCADCAGAHLFAASSFIPALMIAIKKSAVFWLMTGSDLPRAMGGDGGGANGFGSFQAMI